MNKDKLIAEWVGTHYSRNFDAMGEAEKSRWRSRYCRTFDDGFGRHSFTNEELITEIEATVKLIAERDALLAALKAITSSSLTTSARGQSTPLDDLKAAMVAIATATGKSTFGNDWMDALDQQGDTP